jgi:hypothetical protein
MSSNQPSKAGRKTLPVLWRECAWKVLVSRPVPRGRSRQWGGVHAGVGALGTAGATKIPAPVTVGPARIPAIGAVRANKSPAASAVGATHRVLSRSLRAPLLRFRRLRRRYSALRARAEGSVLLPHHGAGITHHIFHSALKSMERGETPASREVPSSSLKDRLIVMFRYSSTSQRL